MIELGNDACTSNAGLCLAIDAVNCVHGRLVAAGLEVECLRLVPVFTRADHVVVDEEGEVVVDFDEGRADLVVVVRVDLQRLWSSVV